MNIPPKFDPSVKAMKILMENKHAASKEDLEHNYSPVGDMDKSLRVGDIESSPKNIQTDGPRVY